ncbi:MAG: hypothetical protein R3F12_15060 [Lysobacteraceae bacterium]|nr:hypothetical protein [Xanthomonadales bacterium]
MKPERSMAFVGVTETISLRIRQQIRRVEERLEHDWKWVGADNPDLVFIDPDSDDGKMARGRAKVTGMRFIEVIDEDMPGNDEAPTLRVPIKQDVLVKLLNQAGTATVATGELAFQNAADFYFRDLQDDDGASPAMVARDPELAQGLEDIIRGEELSEGDRQQQHLASDAGISAGGGLTSRTRAYADRAVDRGIEVKDERFHSADPTPTPATVPPPVSPAAPAAKTPSPSRAVPNARTTAEQEIAGWPLPHFLGEDGPTRPSRYQIDGAPTLYLDPKTREFHAAGDLSELAAYCEHPLNSGEWSALTSAQVNEMRQLPGRPYAELVWLHTWLTGNGHLSNQLDPGGSYRVTRRISIKPEFRQHHAMLGKMQTPARLHEIAAEAKVSMDQVFNLVNAYHAINALEWTRRAPREPVPTPNADREGGLLKRLWPFKR